MSVSLRERLGVLFTSLELCCICLASYVPNNGFRVAVLRLWGAKVGADVAVHHGLRLRGARRLTMGSHIFIGDGVSLDGLGGLTIRDNVSINANAQVWTSQHDWRSPHFPIEYKSVEIGNRAWICSASVVLPGAHIGEGAVLGAGSVASRPVEPFVLATGVPAVAVAERTRDLDYTIHARKSKLWWW